MASTLPANQSVKLTKTVADKAILPASGQCFLRDRELKGFALRITASGAKTFVIEKRIDGKVRRKSIARYGELTVEQARKEAHKFLGKLATGINPIAEKERARLRGTTLAQAFDDFLKVRSELKPRTVYDYRLFLRGPLGDWQVRSLSAISKDMVQKRHAELGQNSGEAYANHTMRFLRGLFNFAIARYEDSFGHPLLTENPVSRLTRTRAWFRTERRQTVIKVHQLAPWYRAVARLRHDPAPAAETVADWLTLLLFTGLRRQEAAQLTWDKVDLKNRTLLIPDPKNRVPHVLPLSDFLVELLTQRQGMARNGYVFPGEGRLGYLIEPKRQIGKVIAESNVGFTIHDLRRTFITIAEGIDIQPYAIKRLVNHKMRNDVTAGYIVTDIERLRQPMQRITDFLLKATGISSSDTVIPLAAPRRIAATGHNLI